VRIISVEKRASGIAKIAIGGSSFLCRPRYLSELGLEPEGLTPGVELDEEAIEILALADKAQDAEARALSLLARAEQSRFLLAVKLERRECSARAVGLALDFLESEGLLDDGRFAEAWLRARIGRAATSPMKLVASLRARGIAEEVAKAALDRVCDPELRLSLVAKAAAKEGKKLQKAPGLDPSDYRAELKRSLRGLGFKSADVALYFENLADSQNDGDRI
jgi:regulatory protein